jgi:hypothetical protein
VLLDDAGGVVENPAGKSERVNRVPFSATWLGVPLPASEADPACPGVVVAFDT